MTREEMDLIRGFVANIQSLKDAHIKDNLPINYGMLCTIVIKGWELLKELKALEQEPCEDAISRQAAQEGLTHLMDSDGFRDSVGYVQKSLVRNMLNNLAFVQPKIKTGHWINKKPRWIPSLSMTMHDAYECSNCSEPGVHYWDYCPYCGARMVEPQESEE